MHTERRSPCVLKWTVTCRRPVIADVIRLQHMKKLCELRKRPTLLATIGVPFLAAIIWLFFMMALNAFVSIEWLNGWLVIAAAVLFLSAPILLWNSEVCISVEPVKDRFQVNRGLLVFGRKIAERSVENVDDVYWKDVTTVENEAGVQYEIYGRYRSQQEGTSGMRDVPILGGFCLLVSLTRNDVDQFRAGFCDLRRAV